ncbi:hypothetical protein BGZ98_003761 [Dissophora globulifera]|nr:hypothetical protein BGZ98_003761 [Dissophora globulifera]
MRVQAMTSANFESSLIDPRGQICLLVRGELKAEIALQGPTVEFTAEQPGVLKKIWTAPVYGTLKNSDGTDLPIRGIGERELKVCFYLPPEFGNTKSGVELQISAKLKGKDKDGDDMRFLCTRGAARTI